MKKNKRKIILPIDFINYEFSQNFVRNRIIKGYAANFVNSLFNFS